MATPDAAGSETVLAELELTRGLAIQMTAIGTLGLVIGWGAFSGVYQLATGMAPTFQFGPVGVEWWTDALDLLVVVILGTAFAVPHELLHGLAIRYYGGRARYGVGLAHFILPYAYATTDHELSRNQFVVVLLTPLVVLTLVGVPLMIVFEWGWLVLPLAMNAAGAIADLWMTMLILCYPAHVRVQDHEDGVRLLGRATDEPRHLSVTTFAWDAFAGAAVGAVVVLVFLAIGGPLVLSALGVSSLTIGTPGAVTYLFSYLNTPTEISLGVGPGVLIVGALVGLTYAFVRSHRRASSHAPAGAGETKPGR